MTFDLEDRTILITGGTGSFGRHFARTILEETPVKKVIIFSRDELKQWEMAQEFESYERRIRFFIGDVRDLDRLMMAFRGVDYVVHAAALKHVTVAEYNPFECIKTNVYGAENVVTAAINSKVKRVVALSTDKAANPINLYGASKLAAEKIFVAARALVGPGEPLFSVVRYGNVVGSRGSVVPLFRRLIGEGRTSLPITDKRMTRFWITLENGVSFVRSSFDMMQGSEIFVPKIPSMKVVDLASTMAPNSDIEQIGIRPGEKLHEVMVTKDEARNTIELPDRFVILEPRFLGQRNYAEIQSVVAEDFQYASDTNTWWLNSAEMHEILGETEVTRT